MAGNTASWIENIFGRLGLRSNGNAVPAQPNVNFEGDGVAVTPDPANGANKVTIPGGSTISKVVDASSPAVTQGYGVMQKNGKVTLANSGALGVSLYVAGLALGGATANAAVQLITHGPIDPSVFNLGAGVACAVGLDTNGKPVRVTDPTCVSGLKYVGACDVNGAIYVNPRTEAEYWTTDFGAANDATTDDTAAVQAAITRAVASGHGVVRAPAGPGHKITSTLVATGAVTIRGDAKPAGGGGTTGISSTSTLIHAFDGTLIHFNGASGTATSQGGGVERLRLYQAFNDGVGTATCGVAILVDCTDANHRPGYMRIHDLVIDEGATNPGPVANNPWEWAVVIDGSNDTTTPGISNMFIESLDTHTNNASTGVIKIVTATVNIHNCHHSLEGNYLITGISGFPASSVQLVDVSCKKITLDYAQDFTFIGGILGGTVTTSSNTSGAVMILPSRRGAGATISDGSTSALGVMNYDAENVGNAPGSFRFSKPILLANSQGFLGLNATNDGTIFIAFVSGDNVVRLGQNSPVGFGNNPATTNAADGDIVLTNGNKIRMSVGGGTAQAYLGIDGSDRLELGNASFDVKWMKPQIALGGGSAATLGTIGGSGPTAAAQQDWLRVVASDGTVRWIPCWA